MANNSAQIAPEYSLHRTVSAVDNLTSTPVTDAHKGINMGGYGKAHIQVVPHTADNPTAEVFVWSEEAGKFISINPAISKTGLGNGVPYEFTFDCAGRIMYVALTANITNPAKVFVSGYEMQHTP